MYEIKYMMHIYHDVYDQCLCKLDSDFSKKGMELRRCKKQNSKEHKIVFSHNFLTSGPILMKF